MTVSSTAAMLSGSGGRPAGETLGFHPLTAAWFVRRFDAASPAQLEAWPRIRAGGDVLISAPTGSGKTLAAFLSCLDRLVSLAAGGGLEDRTAVVYVSPLKALSTDIHRNLQEPLGEIAERAAAGGRPYPEIRTAIRTGDTPAWDREQMVRRPPHIVVTTPESLFILLTAERSRRMLSTAETVIVDEIHALIDDKRGSHLALSLARLDDLVVKSGGAKPQRIGLSATVKPIDEVARFLTGVSGRAAATVGPGVAQDAQREDEEPAAAGSPNGGASEWPPVAIVDSGHRRELDLAVEVPQDELGVVATNEMWGEIYERIAELVRGAPHHHRLRQHPGAFRSGSPISSRSGSARDAVLAHHGSLSRQLRQTAEAALKEGRLRAVVATASLELGIDVGSVDLVCQIGTPRSIAVALQADSGVPGHKVDRAFVAEGPLLRNDPGRADRVARRSCAAIRRGLLDERRLRPWAAADVLAQQIVAAAADRGLAGGRPCFALARSTAPYRDLPAQRVRLRWWRCCRTGFASPRGRHGTWLHRDRVNGVVRGRRGARLAAITSGGAIPDNANYLVVAEPEGTTVGTVRRGLRGRKHGRRTSSCWARPRGASVASSPDACGSRMPTARRRRCRSGSARRPGRDARALRRGVGRSRAAGRARRCVPRRQRRGGRFLIRECGLDRSGAEQAGGLRPGPAPPRSAPCRPIRTLVAERFFDEGGGMQLVLPRLRSGRPSTAPGAWRCASASAGASTSSCRRPRPTTAIVNLPVGSSTASRSRSCSASCTRRTVEEVLTQAMLPAPMFGARWRWNASRALAVLRFAGGAQGAAAASCGCARTICWPRSSRTQVACQENLAGDISDPRPSARGTRTIRDCLHEAMDLDGLRAVIAGIEQGTIATRGRPTPPSRRRSGTRS